MIAATDSQRLDDLIGVAHRLGMVFGQEAERIDAMERKLPLLEAFSRCFFSVRVGIALKLRLAKEAGAPAVRPEREVERPEPPELERPERGETFRFDERDRERDVERASLPLLLRTLEGVAADAEALLGPQPAELPTLRELLARVKADAPAPAARPLRARLTGSATTVTLPRPGPRAASPLRRATGPPHR